MKKVFLLALLVFCYSAADSQIIISLLLGDKLNNPGLEFGLEGGLTISNVSKLETKKSLNALGLGFYFDIKLKNQIYLNTGVYVKSTYGSNYLTDNDLSNLGISKAPYSGNYKLKINYFYVPILIRYRFKNHFYAEMGPQAGLRYNSMVEFNDDVDGLDIRIRTNNKNKIYAIDAGFTGGIGYILRKGTGMTIGVKYYYGLAHVIKDVSGSKNSSLFIKLNIPIGREKQTKEA